jgi:DNA polymerase III subunit delta'
MAAARMSAVLAPWQQRAYDQAADALDHGRMGHALLFCGPGHLGKGQVAGLLAQRQLCTGRAAATLPCGGCRSCQLFQAGSHPDFHRISFIFNKEGTRLRTEIIIEQVRQLSDSLALTPQYGGAQIALIDPADAVNRSACNALLKTLEEPHPGRYLWLVSANPAHLPATIRSRCQRLEFVLPPLEEGQAWLVAQGHAHAAAADALLAARGHPGLADAWLRDGGMALRREVEGDLSKLGRGEAAALETAQRWTGDERADLRLRHAADLAVAHASRLTDPRRTRTLAAWFDQANRTRELLRTTVRADLAVAELLVSWSATHAPADASRPGGRG